ncbi:sulfite exporter TauE/SafE family protein [Arthrobacter sp. UM1]|uniref:sulfite exporter TauE/SafE family protein n=1 Tax=Arthrobacter sp. UM1 TaxID=2766776 RepID=UPI001CF638BF|nr:sulfite exporter TauE/SafE family protein [Arthrobacter sp. UM1]MCB4207478.1 sulfite exporter TauE/SafE family protein [Arthrobacter sp. UM1]
MSLLDVVLIALAGLWAGGINVVVGSGTLVTFPVLVALGFPPVTATMSNAMGLIAGNASGVIAYRRELKTVRRELAVLAPASLLGGIAGSSLLLHLPESVFGYVAPFLTLVAILCVVFQPRLARIVAARREEAAQSGPTAEGSAVQGEASARKPRRRVTPLTVLLVFLTGVYGGYFVAAQGVLLMGILGIFLMAGIQRENALKNLLVMLVNLVAAVSYVLLAFDRINWWVVLVIAVSSFAGGTLGGKIARRLKPVVLRGIIVALGVVALAVMIGKLVA